MARMMNLPKSIGTAILLTSLLVFVCVDANPAAPINRYQRQTLAGELTTGLTGTGTSFNSYNGYDSYPYQQYVQGYDDPLYNSVYDYNQYGKNDRSPYGGVGGMGVGGMGGWRGFGMGTRGRNPYNRNKFGVKY